MTLGCINVTCVVAGAEHAYVVRLISDHRVEIQTLGTYPTVYQDYGSIPAHIRQALDAMGRASAVEHHLSCSVS